MIDKIFEALLKEVINRREKQEKIKKLIKDNFTVEFRKRVSRIYVYEMVAEHIGEPVSNQLCIEVKELLGGIGAYPAKSHGILYFLNLNPIHPIPGVKSGYSQRANGDRSLNYHRQNKPSPEENKAN